MPHCPEGHKLLSLIKYAKTDKKPIFCSGVSFFSLIYNLSTNYELDLNIINVTKEFQTIEDFSKIPKKILAELNLKDRFIDFVTGDLYQHSLNTSSWTPIENVGYHNRIIAAKYGKLFYINIMMFIFVILQLYLDKRGKVVSFMEDNMKKAKINKNLFQGTTKELECFVVKNFVQHWLVKDLVS